MLWLALFAAGIAGMLLSLYGAHRKRRRIATRFMADLRKEPEE